MKIKLYKLLSLILVIASLVSSFAVFTFAEDDEVEDTDSSTTVIYNRGFSEGWDYDNGFSKINIGSSGHTVSIDKEELQNGTYNYFMRMETALMAEGYLELQFNASDVAKEDQFGTVVEMRLKADDYAYNYGQILALQNPKYTFYQNLLYVEGDKIIFNQKSEPVVIGTLSDEWINVAIGFDWTTDVRTMTVYYGDFDEATHTYSESHTYVTPYVDATEKGILRARFYIPTCTTPDRTGMSICIDDLKLYNGSAKPIPINENDPGNKINILAEKVITILESASNKTSEQILKEALCMKVGVNHALVRDERKPITDGTYGAPVIIDGTVRVPFDILLNYIGYPYYVHPDNASYDITTGTSATYLTVGRDSATVDGKRVELSCAPGYVEVSEDIRYLTIGLDDIEALFPGWLVAYDDMGLIVIYEDATPDDDSDNADIITRDKDLEDMLSLMKKFIFDVDMVEKKAEYIDAGKKIYEDIKKNTLVKKGDSASSFNHPYIIANQSTFDTLKGHYSGNDATLKGYIQSIINEAELIYNDVAETNNGGYVKIKNDKLPLDPLGDYSVIGGRLETLTGFSEKLIPLAFAYQMTGNKNFALLAYDYMSTLGEWEHWGPAYMIDCAEATLHFALAYDWLYNGFVSLELDVDAIAEILYEKGVRQGYVASQGLPCEYDRVFGDLSDYTKMNDYWNAVGSAGMIIGSMALMDKEEYLEAAYYIVGNNLANLCLRGLDVYAPDGAYVESATNWNAGTNSLFYLIMALDTAAGSTYGYENTWGLDKTCYYAIHIESSDGFVWNYNDGGFDGATNGELATMETGIFNYVGKIFSDPTLISVRQKQIASGKKPVTVFDLFFYPYEGVEEAEELPLSYHMTGLEAFIHRSDWSDGALYTGIMGGPNNSNYGQIDSSNFIYHNNGVAWFIDLGSEHYGAYQYYGTERYKYYRANAEGQNVIYMPNESALYPYGQSEEGSGKIMTKFENEYGTYAVLDNTSAFSDIVASARRGILIKNDDKTVVIQDEINFSGVRDARWVAHTDKDVMLSQDGKTAYLKHVDDDGKSLWVRVTLVSPVDFYQFKLEYASEYKLESTYGPKDSANKGGAPEYSRSGIKKLVVEADDTTNFFISIVIEVVEGTESTEPVGYEFADMHLWTLTGDEDVGQSGSEEKRDVPRKSDIRTYTNKIKSLFDEEIAFTEELNTLYSALTLINYTFKAFPPESSDELANAYMDYLDYCDAYEEYYEYVNANVDTLTSIASLLNGLYEAPADDAE